jgi:threonine dehydrogenase-like Zn-dependent dehydrogenase
MKNLYEKLQAIKDASHEYDVREMVRTLQSEIVLGDVIAKDEPSFAETGDDHLSYPCVTCGQPAGPNKTDLYCPNCIGKNTEISDESNCQGGKKLGVSCVGCLDSALCA